MLKGLVERIRNHDQRAMGELYHRCVGRLSSVCRRYVSSEDEAKDVLQNSFVRIFTALPSFEYRDEASFHTWMRRIVTNEALHLLREQKRLRFVEFDETFVADMSDEEPAIEHITADELHLLIRQLPDGYRTVVNLYVFEGYSHRQIAEMLNIKETTSASQFYHAKLLLAKRIKDLINRKP